MATSVSGSGDHGVFVMGSMCCPLCGHWISQQNQNQQKGTVWCQRCGSLKDQSNKQHACTTSSETPSNLLFTQEEIRDALAGVRARMVAAASTGEFVGTTRVDNRVLEEAFCETCSAHRQCKVFARQTRSADEGQTIFYQCIKCKAEWQLNS